MFICFRLPIVIRSDFNAKRIQNGEAGRLPLKTAVYFFNISYPQRSIRSVVSQPMQESVMLTP